MKRLKGLNIKDKYRRDSVDGSTTWGEGYQFVGVDGKPGADGTDASVTFANVKSALQKAASTQQTFITADAAGAPNIYGGNIYGANIYAGGGDNTFAKMSRGGFQIFRNDVDAPKAQLVVNESGSNPSLILGSGSDPGTSVRNRFYVCKTPTNTTLFYTDANGKQSGFLFGENGAITPIGELSVTARFT